jgi:hypothetical protein
VAAGLALASSYGGAIGSVHGQPEARRGPKYPVLIDSTPAGATVYLTGRDRKPLGSTPYKTSLEAGSWKVILDLDGYQLAETAIEVDRARKRQTFRIDLVKLGQGKVEVAEVTGVSGEQQAQVFIDGNRVGTAPGTFDVAVGPHQVEVKMLGREPFEEWVEVEADGVVNVRPKIEGAPAKVSVKAPPKREPLTTVPPLGPTRGVASAMVILDSGVDVSGRHFSYRGDMQSGNLRSYDADGIPRLHLGLEVYPLARIGPRIVHNLGIAARLSRSLGLNSTTNNGMSVDTSWLDGDVGLRARYAPARGFLVGAEAGYGTARVLFGSSDLQDEAPEVAYEFIRLAGDVRYTRGRLAGYTGLTLPLLRSSGTVASRFRRARTNGFGGHLGAAYGLIDIVEARVTATYQRFSTQFEFEPGDQYFADGSTDHFYGVVIGAAMIY